jgi:hypothetical protein
MYCATCGTSSTIRSRVWSLLEPLDIGLDDTTGYGSDRRCGSACGDVRERTADVRERTADVRERTADVRERTADVRERVRRRTGRDAHGRSAMTTARSAP